MSLRKISKLVVLVTLGCLVYFAGTSDLVSHYLSLDYFKQNKLVFDQFYEASPLATLGIFFFIYVFLISLSIPGAALMTLLAGSLFGFIWGTVVVSFASSMGAVLAFLVSRFILREIVEKKFSGIFKKINRGIEERGKGYLFTLRLVPVFPFFLINLVMGLTQMKTLTFYWVSQLGMLCGTMVYVNAGFQLTTISSLKDVLSFEILVSFGLIGVLPLLFPKLIRLFQNRRMYAGYKRPRHFDYNLAVIGGGSAGLVSSYIAATLKAKVILIEKDKMGGDCLNTGCVPSKAFIRSAKTVMELKKAKQMGIEKVRYQVNFRKVMQEVKKVVEKIAPHDSTERYEKLGVECARGEATIVSPWKISISSKGRSRVIKVKKIVVATGARPFHVPLKNIDQIQYLNSDRIWDLKKIPAKLVVLGGGPIGCELAQTFAILGSKVTQVEMASRIMQVEDVEVSEFVTNKFKQQGIKVLTEHQAQEVEVIKGKKYLIVTHRKAKKKIPFDELLVAVGRKANVSGFGLEELGVRLRSNGTIEANDLMQTNYPNIFVCGDVTGPFQFTHVASHQAWYATINALLGFVKFKVDYRVIPWCTFTQPEVASVGLNEQRAKAEGIDYELSTYSFSELDRAIADREDEGFIRVLTAKENDKILGVTILGSQASNLILEFVTAMKHKLGLGRILSTIHIYPTWGEANKYLSGNWRRKHSPKRLLAWVEKFHRWNLK